MCGLLHFGSVLPVGELLSVDVASLLVLASISATSGVWLEGVSGV